MRRQIMSTMYNNSIYLLVGLIPVPFKSLLYGKYDKYMTHLYFNSSTGGK